MCVCVFTYVLMGQLEEWNTMSMQIKMCRNLAFVGKKLLPHPLFSLYTPEYTHSYGISIKIIQGKMCKDDIDILSSCVIFQVVSSIGWTYSLSQHASLST